MAIMKKHAYLGLLAFAMATVSYLTIFHFGFGYHQFWYENKVRQGLSQETAQGNCRRRHKLLDSSPVVLNEHPSLFESGVDASKCRFESIHRWRPEEFVLNQDKPSRDFRTGVECTGQTSDRALVQPIVEDSTADAERVFLMIKTGADVLWERIPIHFLTTLTKFPNFALYSDFPGSIGGHQVVDILEKLPPEIKALPDFDIYNALHEFRDQNYTIDNHFRKSMVPQIHGASWTLDRYKNIPMLAHAYEKSPNSDWYVFMDGDSYIFADGLLSVLNQFDPKKILYAGHACGSPSDRYNFANGGTVVVLSHKVMEKLFGQGKENTERLIQWYDQGHTNLGDKAVAVMLADELDIHLNSISGFYGFPIHQIKFHPETWCNVVISSHKIAPRDIELYWEYEKVHQLKRNRLIREGDVYRDFVQPYLSDRKEMWDNELDEPKHAEQVKSADECARTCASVTECLSWRFEEDTVKCEWSKVLQMGHSTKLVNNYGDIPRNITSGWELERLEAAQGQKCALSNQVIF